MAVFDAKKSVWSLVEDYRGKTVYDTRTSHAISVTETGPLPDNSTSLAPEGAYQKWDGKKWVHDADAEKADLAAQAEQQKNSFLVQASQKISPLQEAVDLEIATDDESMSLIEWRKYRVLLNRSNIDDAPDIKWPAQP